MVIDTEVPSHACGKVMDFCTFHDTKIFFCIFCKKVIKAAKEPDIHITIHIQPDGEMNEYDTETLEELR